MPTKFAKKTSKSSLTTVQSCISTKTSATDESDFTSRSRAGSVPNASNAVSSTRTSKPATKPKYSRPPSPPSLYSSFEFEGPIKKPQPLWLNPKKGRANIKVQSGDAGARQLKLSDKDKEVQPVPDEISLVSFRARSSTVSSASSSPPSTICFAYLPRDNEQLATASRHSYDDIFMDAASNSPERGNSATTDDLQSITVSEKSDSTSRLDTPLPVNSVIPSSQLRQRNFDKLTRTLGENVPAELVFKQARSQEIDRETKKIGWVPGGKLQISFPNSGSSISLSQTLKTPRS